MIKTTITISRQMGSGGSYIINLSQRHIAANAAAA